MSELIRRLLSVWLWRGVGDGKLSSCAGGGSAPPVPLSARSTMIIRRDLARASDRILIEIQFVEVSGQVCDTSYEVVDGTERHQFDSRGEAEAAFLRAVAVLA